MQFNSLEEAIARRNADMETISIKIAQSVYTRGWQGHMTPVIDEINRDLVQPLVTTTKVRAVVKAQVTFEFSTEETITAWGGRSGIRDALMERLQESESFAEAFRDSPLENATEVYSFTSVTYESITETDLTTREKIGGEK